jgi:peptide/nickel transport system ATP-binding protein
MSALLEVEHLCLSVAVGGKLFDAVTDLSFAIERGQTFGLVGESGCGKSITALALIGLLRRPLAYRSGKIRFKGQEIQNLGPDAMRQLRGRNIAMVFQEPMTALNPLATVGRQIAEMFVLHQGMGWHEADKAAVLALAKVRVPAPEQRVKDYPHQLSGGMRQRVMIAIALACKPDLLLADEPTTALDVTVQAEILELIDDLSLAEGTAVLLISHDLAVIAQTCERVGVMYAGRMVEQASSRDIFRQPRHPYTRGLIGSLPLLGARALNADKGRDKLQEIQGMVPAVTAFPAGCCFHPRCDKRTQICIDHDPALTSLGQGASVRCHHHA